MAKLRPSRYRRGLLLWLPFLLAAVMMACGGQSSSSDAGAANGDDGTEEQAKTTEAATSSSTTTTNSTATTNSTETSASEASTTAPAPKSDPEVEPVVYAGDFSNSIQPIFADRCASCHSPGGPGTGHWVLGTAEDLVKDHQELAQVVATEYMPPWPAGGDSPRFHQDRSLRSDQIQAIVDWSDDGALLDVAPDTVIEPTDRIVALADPDKILTASAPYTGSVQTIDDYRCQIYDPQLPDGGWITGYEFIPDQTEVVHHAIGYMIPPSARARAESKDGEDGRPGWSCFGSSGLGEDDIFIGWAPGQNPTEMPEGTGLRVEPGAFIVIQIHYHYETDAPADLSQLALKLAGSDRLATEDGDLQPITVSEYVAPAEIPCSTEETGPLCDRDAAMAAAVERYGPEGVQADAFLSVCRAKVEDFADMTDGTASSSCDIPVAFVGGTGEIVSVLGHEHEIGAWFKMTVNPGQPDEKVLLDIPDWNFDWQYNYRPVEKIVLDADDVVRIECGWDRARRDKDLEPAYVLWADGTDDEMCFATISTRPAT